MIQPAHKKTARI
uniref:Uncharacterized protein n=1 Tax=Arundo donax TaxID=35708 RepID=A0A0A8Y4J4_ARUDO